MELVNINNEIISHFTRRDYKYAICSLLDEGYKKGEEITKILLTPVKNMVEGFFLLPKIQKSSYVADIKEIEQDLRDPLLDAEDVAYVIDKSLID